MSGDGMSDRKHGTAIEWTHGDGFRGETWNPVTGCSKISPGCANCYAETISLRYGTSTLPWTPENADANVELHPERLNHPFKWRTPRMVFVNSMSDLFHELVPDRFILEVFAVMQALPRHTFQVLTKRPERARDLLCSWRDSGDLETAGIQYDLSLDASSFPLPNVWMGVSIENSRFTWRADVLRQIPAAVRFLSCEPLLGSLFKETARNLKSDPANSTGLEYRAAPLDLTEIDWVIAGGESGKGFRPIDLDWVRELRDVCVPHGPRSSFHAPVAFFFKQVGGRTPKSGGRELDGRVWDEMPA